MQMARRRRTQSSSPAAARSKLSRGAAASLEFTLPNLSDVIGRLANSGARLAKPPMTFPITRPLRQEIERGALGPQRSRVADLPASAKVRWGRNQKQ